MSGQANCALVFVTGVGQTWSTLARDPRHRWNLFPGDRAVLFSHYPAGGRRRLLNLTNDAARYLRTGRLVSQIRIEQVAADLLRHCIVGQDGSLPKQVDVRIYGARSFDVLGRTDFATGGETDGDDTLLRRLLRDVPVGEFLEECGAENLYCFNYSPFTDLYASARALREMLLAVVEDQKEKTGADKVVLIPMSMGAAVVRAYMDLYYPADGAVLPDLVRRIVSVVGAWDGSDAFANLLQWRPAADFPQQLCEEILPNTVRNKSLLHLLTRDPVRTTHLLRQAMDALLDMCLLHSSSFLAMVPLARWDTLYGKLFSADRFIHNPRFRTVQAQADRFIACGKHLRAQMERMQSQYGTEFAFVGGCSLAYGEGSKDFSFLRLFGEDGADTDGVLPVSSTVPGVAAGEPTPDFSDAWFPQTSCLFQGRPHEIGCDPSAMRLILDLALGKTDSVPTNIVTDPIPADEASAIHT
ncbi:MAG: hypothetical protein IJT41_06780 [Clostridia bacterium]|nr:hypothetical protein [Clostridia bacterium]